MKLDDFCVLKIAVILVVFISFHAVFKECIEEYNHYKRHTTDDVAQYENAYRRIKPFLPPQENIGFITDGSFDEKTLYLAQYALSPVQVINNSDPQFLVAYIYTPSEVTKFAKKQNLHIVHRADENIFLLKKSLK